MKLGCLLDCANSCGICKSLHVQTLTLTRGFSTVKIDILLTVQEAKACEVSSEHENSVTFINLFIRIHEIKTFLENLSF
jgi:hypothetical protein